MVPCRMVLSRLGREADVSAELGSSAASFTAELVRISHRFVWCQSARLNLMFSQNNQRWVAE